MATNSGIEAALGAAAAPETQGGGILAALNAAGTGEAPSSAAPVTTGERFGQGFTDLPMGLGQLAEHVAETPLNVLRTGIRKALNAMGASNAASLFSNVSTEDFDRIVQQREADYQASRQAAGQTGIDWWRLGGSAADPLNYLGAGGAASTALGRIGQAALQGSAVSAAQPSVAPGSFWWDKVKGGATGALLGGATGTFVESLAPALRWGVNAIRSGLGAKTAAVGANANTVVNSTLHAAGVDPASVNINVVAGLKQEVQSALEHEAEPDATAIVNRARAESLPVPVRLMRGQATGDPIAFSTEQNLRGITGVGEPLTARLQEQNSAFVANLDALGAKNAPDPISTGSWLSEKVQGHWDALETRKNALYDAVRNSRGQPAMMDQFAAVKNIRDALDTPQASHAFDLLPDHIKATLGDLESGDLPLTVAQMQSLDKTWGADARAADGSTRYAIETARRYLNEAPVQEDLGQQARAAYQAAKQAHAQQMGMIDPKLPNGRPNPNFQPLVKAVVMDGTPPEKLFGMGFQNAPASVGAKNLSYLTSIDQNAPEMVGRTLMGEIKRQALSSASDERGTVSQSVLNGWANDPVKSARLDALLPQPAVQTFRNLAATVEAAKRFPVASTVNTSNTGSAVVNAGLSMLKTSAAAQIAKRLPFAKQVAEGMTAAKTQSQVQGALNPGVTLNSLMSSTPSQAFRRRLTSTALTPAIVAEQGSSNE